MSKLFESSRIVEFSETDAAGIAHFSNYFRWMEAAEHIFFRDKLSFPIFDRIDKSGFPRAKVHCEFFKPLYCGDEVFIHLQVTKIRKSSIKYHFSFFRNNVGEKDLCAEGDMITVYASENDDGEIVSVELPAVLRSILDVWCTE